ncbi:MAG: CNNM domain-containing protein [Planctomycetota bacterium]|nr:CNNM domain-containing protein [Planctomycetota bacterium]
MSWSAHLAILGGCLLLSAYFSGSETGAYSLNRLRLRYRVGQGERSARVLTDLLSNMEILVSTILLGNSVMAYLATVVVTAMFDSVLRNPVRSEVATVLVLTPVFFVFAEVLPKEIFRNHADTLLYSAARSLRWMTWIFYPLTLTLRVVIVLIGKLIGEEARSHTLEVSPARLRFTFAEGAESGLLTEYQDEIVKNIFDLREVRVRDVFIPLKRVKVTDNTLGKDAFLEFARLNRFSRIPIWQGRKTNIVGAVHVFDVLTEDRPGLTIRNYIRETPRIPPDASIYQALLTLQASRTPLGVVVRNGEALGIVTVKDLIEEIVGELEG